MNTTHYSQRKPRPPKTNYNLPPKAPTIIPPKLDERGPAPPSKGLYYKKIVDEEGDTFYYNPYINESHWRLPAGAIEIELTEEEKAKNAQNKVLAKQRKEQKALKKEREIAGLEQAKARSEYEAEQAERERLRATEAPAPESSGTKPRILSEEEKVKIGNRLLEMGFKQLRRMFEFPETGLTKAQEKQLEKKAKKFLTINYHPDKNPTNNKKITALYDKLDLHFGMALGSPPRERILVGGKKRVPFSGPLSGKGKVTQRRIAALEKKLNKKYRDFEKVKAYITKYLEETGQTEEEVMDSPAYNQLRKLKEEYEKLLEQHTYWVSVEQNEGPLIEEEEEEEPAPAPAPAPAPKGFTHSATSAFQKRGKGKCCCK